MKTGRPAANKGCSVEGCNAEKHYARTYCRMHYARWKTTGTTDLKLKPERPVTYCDCGELAEVRDMCLRHYRHWWYHNRQGRSTGKRWQKDIVSYASMHSRLRSVRGHAKDFACVLCGKQAYSWALSADCTELILEITPGRTGTSAYSLDPYDYLPMCDKDHRAYDALHKNRSYKLQASRWEE